MNIYVKINIFTRSNDYYHEVQHLVVDTIIIAYIITLVVYPNEIMCLLDIIIYIAYLYMHMDSEYYMRILERILNAESMSKKNIHYIKCCMD